MSYSAGAVHVTANVTAMEDGYPDEEIMVKSELAKRLMPVVVVDANTVTPAR
jgi:flagella basal body P-ring formation protein FlgA